MIVIPSNPSGVINFTDLAFTLLYRCNYRCPSCLLGNDLKKSDIINYNDAIKIIDSMLNLCSINILSFVGGEPFLVYDLMLKIADYAWKKYRMASGVSTNSYWANELSSTREKLIPLYNSGLRWILLSWDDFHAQFGQIEQIANTINVCSELNIKPTLQNIYTNNSKLRIESIRRELKGLCDIRIINWIDSPCVPVGFGSMLDNSLIPTINIEKLPYGGCSAGSILNIQPNGDIKPCCGAGLVSRELSIGNIKSEGIDKIVQRASVDPIINSLIAYMGPKYLISLLKKFGRDDLIPTYVSNSCDACYKLLDNPETTQLLREELEKEREHLLFSRIMHEEFNYLRPM